MWDPVWVLAQVRVVLRLGGGLAFAGLTSQRTSPHSRVWEGTHVGDRAGDGPHGKVDNVQTVRALWQPDVGRAIGALGNL